MVQGMVLDSLSLATLGLRCSPLLAAALDDATTFGLSPEIWAHPGGHPQGH